MNDSAESCSGEELQVDNDYDEEDLGREARTSSLDEIVQSEDERFVVCCDEHPNYLPHRHQSQA